jgi:arabinofuranosyltransferase
MVKVGDYLGKLPPRIFQRALMWVRQHIFALAGGLVVLSVILPNAWLGDDIFISLRTAKNIVLGYGPVWNLDDRVQAFTHPLWELLLTLCQLLFPYATPLAVIWLGIGVTLLAVVLFFKDLRSKWVMLLALIALVSSKAFIDYSTSGLENPALYVLVILFAHEYLSKQRVFWLTLLAALAAVTRLDSIVLFLPAFVPLVRNHWRFRTFWLDVAKGAIPLIAWELFSVIYYGYFLPNTVYAKTLTYIPQPIMYQHGLNFFANSLDWDKITLPIILLALVFVDLTRHKRQLALAAGIVCYLLIVFHTGGDYMSGRFLAVPFFLSLYLVSIWLQNEAPRYHRFVLPGLATAVLLLAVITPRSPLFQPLVTRTNHTIDLDMNHGNGEISDEADVYCPDTCLFHLRKLKTDPYYKQLLTIGKQKVVEFGSIGLVGYYANPHVHIVDQLALADPLLSHLTADLKSRIGHFHRDVTPDYLASIEQHKNLIQEPCMHRLYSDILPAVSGPIFSLERLKKIIKLNTGYSDHKYEHCVQRGGKTT